MNIPRLLVLITIIMAAAASRLLPHPPNVAPIGAMALFGGASFGDRRLAFVVPLAAMILSDLVIGFHRTLPFVYGAFALIVLIGFWLRRHRTTLGVVGAMLAGSIVFFLLANFGVWVLGSFYPRTLEGLLAAYVAAIPFFRNTVVGDLFYATVLFGGQALLERSYGVLREHQRTIPGQP
ncbi:MAG: hypothetical protein FJ280_28495 [Planctomycetes bacterium]|nr:hypothetical protein [Chloroflexota bacterium]MBM4029303.1 hypothetical protein [Planctomycetota bacterium]